MGDIQLPRDETKALTEMRRVLKTGGIAIINAPVDPQRKETFENPEYNTPELRLKHFGQHDHVRIYGMDYAQRLEKVFSVEVLEPNRRLSAQQLKDYAVWEGDRIYVCRK
jgi:ubiquinone/menaquinone biosynthesis C-methylase UbiE